MRACVRERERECETENNKIEKKNSVEKCVGETQRHRESESSWTWSFRLLSAWLRPTVVGDYLPTETIL